TKGVIRPSAQQPSQAVPYYLQAPAPAPPPPPPPKPVAAPPPPPPGTPGVSGTPSGPMSLDSLMAGQSGPMQSSEDFIKGLLAQLGPAPAMPSFDPAAVAADQIKLQYGAQEDAFKNAL